MSYIRLLFMIQVQILVGDLHKGYLVSDDIIRGHQQVFANNSRLKRVRRGRGLIVFVLSRHIAWYGAWPTWVNMRPHLTLTWGQILTWPFKVTMGTCFDAPWRKEYRGARIKPLASLVRMLFAKTILPKKAFWRFFTPKRLKRWC